MWKIIQNAYVYNTHQYVFARCPSCKRVSEVRLNNIRRGRSTKCPRCAAKTRKPSKPRKPADRTLKIIELLKEGRSAKEIAQELGCSANRAYDVYATYIKKPKQAVPQAIFTQDLKPIRSQSTPQK